MTGQFLLLAVMIHTHRARTTPVLAWSSIPVMLAPALALALRALIGVFGDTTSVAPAASSAHQLVSLIIGALFMALSSLVFIAMVSERYQRETMNRLRRDRLTGLYTRTAFYELAHEIERSAPAQAYAVVLFDIDFFKSVNDTYGHGGGDATLAHAARMIANSTRISDLACRYGGEEFCVLLRGCTEAQAADFAQRLVNEASQQQVRLRDGRTVGFTMSAGYASAAAHASPAGASPTLDELIELADGALYRAKNGGRNRALSAHRPAPAQVVAAA